MALRLGNGVVINTTSTGTPVTGFWLPMGDPNDNDGDGSLTDGAIPLTETQSVSSAIDQMNEFLLRMVPQSPTPYPNGTLSQHLYTAGSSPKLCTGTIPDNTLGGTIPVTTGGDDAAPYRGISATFDSTTLNDNGFGDSGSVYVSVNNSKQGELVFTANTGDAYNSNGLVVTDNNWFPLTQPNFYQTFDVEIENAVALDGWNRYSIVYVDNALNPTISNEVYILKDNVTSSASYVHGTTGVGVAGTLSYSSGIPHYASGATLAITGSTLNNLSGYTYTDDDPLQVSSTGGGLFTSDPTLSHTALGITTPMAVGTTGHTVPTYNITLNDTDSHIEDTLRFRARNVNGYSAYSTELATKILYREGTGSGVNETSIVGPTTNTGAKTGHRVDLGIGNTTIDAPSASLNLPSAFDSTQDLSATTHVSEATVVGGVLHHDVRDYTSGYLPTGHDYTGKTAAAQYIDLAFTGVDGRSFVEVSITGDYSGMWIGLEDYSDDNVVSPLSINGTWWDAFTQYSGSGIPGSASAGCADGAVATGTTGTTRITFGTGNTSSNPDSSQSPTPKNIFLRLKLTAGQSITGISVN